MNISVCAGALLLSVVPVALGFSSGGGLAAQDRPSVPPQSLAGTYVYFYEYNIPSLEENHYVVLEADDGELTGWYFGTTDDFDSGREGYLPGFFVAPMADLTVVGNSIFFSLRVSSEECFSKPVPRHYRSAGEVPTDEIERWPQTIRMEPRAYEGVITPDGIEMSVGGRPRSFSKIHTGVEGIP